jgi:hypothetical protein
VDKDSAAHSNAGFFLLQVPLVIFGYVGCKWLLMVMFGLVVVTALSVLAGT